MAVIVFISGERFLIATANGLTGQEPKVEFKKIAPMAMSKAVWIYSMRFGGKDGQWREMCAFADTEYLASGFDVLTTTRCTRARTRIVAMQSFFFHASAMATGTVSLVNNRVK
ncbi:hypothetical protein LLEC1_04701 [Akanthomyces lecanii]|uniref:Uncharacterized protein n=1 Tax=Cordyceps confragosa TaxID=2714763 RepID=A0A179I2A8_CORDF|nr:hypothetical protein LLEC1_04701 [Akanthomyces lecanii]